MSRCKFVEHLIDFRCIVARLTACYNQAIVANDCLNEEMKTQEKQSKHIRPLLQKTLLQETRLERSNLKLFEEVEQLKKQVKELRTKNKKLDRLNNANIIKKDNAKVLETYQLLKDYLSRERINIYDLAFRNKHLIEANGGLTNVVNIFENLRTKRNTIAHSTVGYIDQLNSDTKFFQILL